MKSTTEIVKRVRELEIKSKKLAKDLFSGEYHSAFKGKGMSFKEVREYAPGDDVRFIDWNVSARFGHPYSKLFEEERELTVMLLIDISGSSLFGTSLSTKRDVATEIGAVIAFSAVANGDKLGVIFFSDRIEKFIPPKKGRQHALYVVREMITTAPLGKGTQLNSALKFFNNTIKRASIAFVLSDMLDVQYEDSLRVVGKKHDVIGIRIYDRIDKNIPNLGLVKTMDAETGKVHWVDTNDSYVRKKYEDIFFQKASLAATIFKKAGCDLLHIQTGDNYVNVLQRFFKSRI